MDSGNSGSLPSSSGGDDEYDSRAETFSPFFNSSQSHAPPLSHPPPPMFNPLPNYFDPISQTSLQNPNLEMIWSKPLRSDPNPNPNPLQFFTPSVTVPFPPVRENIAPPRPPPSSSLTPDHNHNNNHSNNPMGVVVRNPKKRSRASRRAPTTVLTTDTNNFRAMVQEFTGIPAPPFASSPFNRTRFDLFGTPSNTRSNNPLDNTSQPPYLLRPFAQKPQPQQPFVSSLSTSSFLVDAIASTSTNNNMQTQTQNQNQNPILTFQSLLQSTQKYPLPDSSILGSCSKGPVSGNNNLDEFGLTHCGVSTNISGLPNLVTPEVTAPRNNNNGYSGSTSSSNLQGGRGEGIVESWICSSDL